MRDLQTDIDRAVAAGRHRGMLAAEELASLLPIDSMTADEIAIAVARIEDSGVEVELDPELLQPRRDTGTAARPPLAAPEEPVPPVDVRPTAAPRQELPAQAAGRRPITRWVTPAVAATVVLLCAAIVIGVAFG
jgi:hypothetical protein